MSMRRDAGFSLVEALVSLFVFGIISAGCVAMLMQSANTQSRVATAHASMRELETARALLSADLAQIVGRGVREADSSQRPRFIGGDADVALAFVRAAAEPGPEGGAFTSLAVVEYAFEENSIVRRSRAYLDATEETPEISRVMFADARDARFEFFDGVIWRTEWLSGAGGQAMPRAVALVATLPRYGEIRIEALTGAQP
jgi:general secretion pathway protein J